MKLLRLHKSNRRKWQNQCKIWSVSNMTTCSNWIRQCRWHCQTSSYLSCGNVELPRAKKDKQHMPNIDWWEAGSDCIFFQPIHTIYSIVWKGLHWVVLTSKHARIRRLTECSGFAVVLNSMHERQKCSLGNTSECHFNKCRVNVPWHLLSYFSVLARRTRRWCPFMPPPTAFWYIWPESSIQAT